MAHSLFIQAIFYIFPTRAPKSRIVLLAWSRQACSFCFPLSLPPFTGCGSFNTNLPTPLWHFLLPPSPELVHAQKDHLPEINLPMPLLLNPVDMKTFKACIDLSCSAFKSVCSCNCEKYNFNQIKTSFKVILVTVLIDTVLVRF